MKKIIVLFVIVSCFIVSLKAQDNYSNKALEERAKIQTRWMRQELSLDSSTASKAYSINLKYAHKMDDLKNSNENRLSKFREFKSLSGKKDEELEAIFSQSQYDLYQKKKEDMKDYLIQNLRNKAKELSQ